MRHDSKHKFATKREASLYFRKFTAFSRWRFFLTLHVVDHLLVGGFCRELSS